MSENLTPGAESGPLAGDSVTPPPATAPEAGTVPPKRRGRPPGSGKKSPLDEKPVESTSAGDTGPKRGRPRKAPEYDGEARARFAKQVQGIHLMAAQFTGAQEFLLSEPESVMLADGIIAVSIEYGLSLSGKTGALLQLLAAAGMIYVPRFAHLNRRMAAEKAARKAAESVIVPEGAAVQ